MKRFFIISIIIILVGFGIDFYLNDLINNKPILGAPLKLLDTIREESYIKSDEHNQHKSFLNSLKTIGNELIFDEIVVSKEDTINIRDFPGVRGYRLPTQKDIEKNTDWYHYLFQSGNNIEEGYLPFIIDIDFNNDGLIDKACILINEENINEGKACFYIKLNNDQYKKYEMDEEFYPTSTFILLVSKGDYMCEWKGSVENVNARKYLRNDGICLSKYESSFSMIIEYVNNKDKFIYGWGCYK